MEAVEEHAVLPDFEFDFFWGVDDDVEDLEGGHDADYDAEEGEAAFAAFDVVWGLGWHVGYLGKDEIMRA